MKFRIRPTRLPVLFLCCAPALGACTTWEEQSAPTPATSREIRAVRLRLDDGFSIVLKNAVVSGDTIVGTSRETRMQTAVALADVRKTEIQRVDPASTFWTAFLGAAAGIAGFVYWATPRT